jgi:hypothetical protein
MVSKKLIGAWAIIDLCLLACGAVVLAFSIIWRAPNVVMNMAFSNADLTAGTILGIALLATFAVSVFAIIQANHVTIGLIILNWMLVVDALGIVIIGTFVWFFTLTERENFHKVFAALSSAQRIEIQDHFKCCGYYGVNDLVEIGGSFCKDMSVVQGLDKDTGFCVTHITNWADMSLNNVFTTIYGFMAVAIALFLATMCVIKKRQEDERFKKIDAKRGGRGFV